MELLLNGMAPGFFFLNALWPIRSGRGVSYFLDANKPLSETHCNVLGTGSLQAKIPIVHKSFLVGPSEEERSNFKFFAGSNVPISAQDTSVLDSRQSFPSPEHRKLSNELESKIDAF